MRDRCYTESMEINLTKEQYRLLVDIAYLGEWTVNAFREPARTHPQYENALSALLSYAAEAGCPELVEPAAEQPSEDLEMDRTIRRFIDEYNDDNFWHELLERLAHRDLEKELGFRAVRDMNAESREDRLEKLKEKYLNELEKNGIDNLSFTV